MSLTDTFAGILVLREQSKGQCDQVVEVQHSGPLFDRLKILAHLDRHAHELQGHLRDHFQLGAVIGAFVVFLG